MILKQKEFELLVIALQACSYEIQNEDRLIEVLSYACKTGKDHAAASVEAAKKILFNVHSIDKKISTNSKSYLLDRISNIERAILQAGIYTYYTEKMTKQCIISECIRITKKFGNPSAINFVHALLDSALANDNFLI